MNYRFIKLFNALSRKKVIDLSTIKQGKLQRKLKTSDLITVGVTATLSISIYIILGEAIKLFAGPGVIISLLIDAIAALMSGVCYAELATRMPITGSAYTFTSATMGEALGFFVSWNLLFEYSIGAALFARGLIGYLDSLLKGKLSSALAVINVNVHFLDFETKLDVLAALLCIILSLVIVFGWEPTNVLLIVTLVGSISVIIIIIIFGFFYADLNNWNPFMPYGFLGIVKGASTCFYSFVGYDVIAMSAEETIDPRKSIPTAIIWTICISAVLFVGVAMVVTLLVPYKLAAINATIVAAFNYHGLYFLSYVIFFGVVLGTVGGLTATLIPLPRLIYAMSEDGLLFSFFNKVNSQNGVPYTASICSGVFTALVAFCFTTHDLIKMTSMGTLMAYSSVCLCVIVLRYRMVSIYLPMDHDLDTRIEVESVDLDAGDVTASTKFSLETDDETESQNVHEKNVATSSKMDGNMQGDSANLEAKITSEKIGSSAQDQNANKSENVQGLHSAKSFARMREYFSAERQPTEKSEAIVNLSCFCLVVEMVALCSLIVYDFKRLITMDIAYIVGLTTLILSIMITLLVIAAQPENKTPIYFRVPVVPWLPALSLFVNIYLIILLDRGSWIRFGIWLFFGIIMYFGYGIRQSKIGQRTEIYTSVPCNAD